MGGALRGGNMIGKPLRRINLSTAWAAVSVALIVGLSTIGALADDDDEANRRSITVEVLRIVLSRDPTEAEIGADMSWHRCIERKADLFASQPEPAATIAEAAIASCSGEMARYMAVFKIPYNKDFGETDKPALIARVMEKRARTTRGERR